MKANRLFKDTKAISPVIATVILVSVTIVVAVAVAYWMSGIAGLYTRFEKIEISSASPSKDAQGNYTITISLRNSGSADATVISALVNGKALTDYSPAITSDLGTGLAINSGKTGTIHLYIQGTVFAQGTTVEIKLHTAAAMDYPVMVTLP